MSWLFAACSIRKNWTSRLFTSFWDSKSIYCLIRLVSPDRRAAVSRPFHNRIRSASEKASIFSLSFFRYSPALIVVAAQQVFGAGQSQIHGIAHLFFVIGENFFGLIPFLLQGGDRDHRVPELDLFGIFLMRLLQHFFGFFIAILRVQNFGAQQGNLVGVGIGFFRFIEHFFHLIPLLLAGTALHILPDQKARKGDEPAGRDLFHLDQDGVFTARLRPPGPTRAVHPLDLVARERKKDRLPTLAGRIRFVDPRCATVRSNIPNSSPPA